MKNIIVIDVDTDRQEQPLMLGKGPEHVDPKTPAEASLMILTDISCVFEALCTLIHMADQNKYAHKAELIKTAINSLNEQFGELPKDSAETEPVTTPQP